MNKAASAARAGGGPQLIVADVLRLCGHGEHDDAKYVPQNLWDESRDCMDVVEKQVIEQNLLTADEIAQIKEKARKDVQEAVAIAQRDPTPDPYADDWSALAPES